MKGSWKVFIALSSMVMLMIFSIIAVEAQTSSPGKVWEISIGHHVSPKHYLHPQVYEPLAAELNKESQGRLKATVFPGAALGKADAVLDLCKAGTIDIVMFYPMYFPSRFSLTDVMSLSFAVPSAEIGRKVMAELFSKKLLDPELTNGIIPALGTTSPTQFFLRKKVTKYEDLKGLRLRTPGGLATEALKVLGASPVTVPGAEFTTAFERGVIDGGVVDFSSGPGYKLQELSKYVVKADLSVAAGGIAVSKIKYDALPQDLQKVIDRAMQHFLINQAKAYDDADLVAADVFKKAGIEVYVLPPAEKTRWMKATEPVYGQWVDNMKKKGLPVDKTYAEFKKLMKGYGSELPL